MLQELIQQIAKQIYLITDTGISIEIKDFFSTNESVIQYELEVEQNVYKITIKLKEHNSREAKKVFSRFLRFIEYSGGSFYIRKSNTESIEYLLVSVSEDNKGFYCQLTFKA